MPADPTPPDASSSASGVASSPGTPVAHQQSSVSSSTLSVVVADQTEVRQRRRLDLAVGFAALLGIAAMWVLGVYAHATTQAVTADVLKVGAVKKLMLLPLSLFEGAYVLAAPLALVIVLARRRQLFSMVKASACGLVAALIAWILAKTLLLLPAWVTAPLTVTTTAGVDIAFNLVLTAFAALFTAAGERAHLRTLRWAWTGLWVVLALGVLRASMTIPSAIISVLIGVMVGAFGRWIFGFDDRRARASDIVEALRHVGLTPLRLVRADVDTTAHPLTAFELAGTPGAITTRSLSGANIQDFTVNYHPPRPSVRHYQLWSQQGMFDVIVNDPGGKLAGTLRQLWNNIRLRGMTRWVSPSLKATVQRATLTAIAASRLGVHLPEPVTLATAGDSLVEVRQSLPPSVRLRDLPAENVTDSVLDQAWHQLTLAHAGAVSHRELTVDAVMVDRSGQVWLNDWENGEVGASELARSIDLAQMLVLQAVCVGRERAIASALRVVGKQPITAAAPLLQEPILSADLGQIVRHTDIVELLRADLLGEEEHLAMEAPQLQRFRPRTVLMVFAGVLALTLILGSLNFQDLKAVLVTANPVWIVMAFALAALTWVGAAFALMAFNPEKLPFKQTFLVQVAASLITVVAPAGLGPATLNLQYLTKKRVPTAVAFTTVTLQQIVQFLVTFVMLVGTMLATGQSIGITLPYSTILAVVSVIAVGIVLVVAVPRLRLWVWAKVRPTWHQIYPRLWWLVGRPRRMLLIVGANLLMNVGFIGAFVASLQAFGGGVSVLTAASTYLLSNMVGSAIPSPGGIGPIEATLWGGLQVAGIATSVALSTAVLYRLATFYGRVPLGWIALRYLQRHHEL